MISEQDAQLDAQGNPGVPRLSPDFLIETYLDHQVSFPWSPKTPHLSGGFFFFFSFVRSIKLTNHFVCVIVGGTFLSYL